MNEYEKVLELLKTKYGWDYFNSLTEQGRKLVGDTIEALDEIRNIKTPEKVKWYHFKRKKKDKALLKVHNSLMELTQ